MADTLTETGSLYSPLMGLIYVFNLIVGTGALTMPRAFGEAGWLVGLMMIIVLAFTSYITVTFVIEAMATANAATRSQSINQMIKNSRSNTDDDDDDNTLESTPLIGHTEVDDESNLFEIREQIEMGHMASIFFNKVGVNLFYLCLALYLYGDLAIYAAAVPKSLRDVMCTYSANGSLNGTGCNTTLSEDDPCWENKPTLTRINVYRMFVAVFFVTMGPFVFFNVQRTKYLQIFTTIMRWLAFITMITLALIRISQGRGEGHPEVANASRIPTLFGVCVYSFMCHHSLPSLATPIRDKKKIYPLFAVDYFLILLFYCILSFTGIFAFRHIEDLYTLNFQPNHCDPKSSGTSVVFIQYFLALFPVFTLSTNFPIIGITLRNNLKALFSCWAPFPWVVDRLVFPVAAILLPFGIALATDNLETLVGITGSYAGSGVQYFIPAALVICSRKYVENGHLGDGLQGLPNKHMSPFKHKLWTFAILIWGLICIIVVTVNYSLYGLGN